MSSATALRGMRTTTPSAISSSAIWPSMVVIVP